MKARKLFVTIVLLAISMLAIVGCASNAQTETTTKEATSTENQENASEAGSSSNVTSKKELLIFDKYYLTMPKIDVRANAETPGKVDTLYVGDEVYFTQSKGEWAEFEYYKDGEKRTAATWIGAISPGIKIHLLEDEYIYRKPGNNTETMGSIVMWREPSDPDLIILWEENDEWLYVLSTEDCRAGYMRADANYEIVE